MKVIQKYGKPNVVHFGSHLPSYEKVKIFDLIIFHFKHFKVVEGFLNLIQLMELLETACIVSFIP